MTVFVGLLGVILGGAAGAVTTFLTTRSSLRLGLEFEHDRALRDQRLVCYQRLFHLTHHIPRHWLLTPVPTRAQLLGIRETFHDWYYGEDAAGMFLSRPAKKAYLDLMDALDRALFVASGDGALRASNIPETALTDEESRTLRKLTSDLRHQLAHDIGASNPPRVSTTPPERTVE